MLAVVLLTIIIYEDAREGSFDRSWSVVMSRLTGVMKAIPTTRGQVEATAMILSLLVS